VSIDRRAFINELLRGGLALTLLPGAAAAAWQSIAAADPLAPARILGSEQSSVIATIADAILPRTDTPSATDVGVVAWIDTVVAGYFSDAERSRFLSGLAALDDHAVSMAGAKLTALRPGVLAGVISSLDGSCGSKDPERAQCSYVELKELIIYGYFTSKPVQRDILQVPIIPGHFDPSVPVAPNAPITRGAT
jgi:gluconate 2-dehydrogenase gamma chain